MKEFLFTSIVFTNFDWGLAAFFGVLFVLAIIFAICKRMNKNKKARARLFGRLFNMSLTIFLLGVLWTSARYFSIPYLGVRFVALLILLELVVWLGFILKYFVMSYGMERRMEEQQALKQRYLS